jgi:hypothetical protein
LDRFGNLIEKMILARINTRRVLRYALYMFLSLLAQTMVLNRLRIAGVCPLVLPAVAVAVGMFEGATWGALFSLLMGIFADMAFIENGVLFTVLFPALAFASGFVSQFFINRRFFAFTGVALIALLITGTLQMLKTLAGDAWSLEMLKVLALQTLLSLPVGALAYPLPARWSRE